MNCNYKVNIKDIQNKYKFNIFAMGGYNDSDLRKMIESVFYALPRTTASGTSVTLNDTARSYMHNELNATDTSQTGTPTPDTPLAIHTITGDNEVVVCGKNICTNAYAGNTSNLYFEFDKNLLANNMSVSFITDATLSGNTLAVLEDNNVLYNFYTIVSGSAGTRVIVDLTFTNEQLETIKNATGIVRFRIYKSNAGFTEITQAQIEQGTATPYQPYQSNSVLLTLGDKEICKIGNYEDKIFKAIKGNEIYDSLASEEKTTLDYGKWYLRKNIGKVVLSTIDTWYKQANGNFYNMNFAQNKGYISGYGLSNIFTYSTTSWIDNCFGISSTGALWLATGDTTITSQEMLISFLGSKNAYMIGVLATPTNELFNDTNQDQLEDIYNNMLSYEGQTNVSQVNEDLPFNINSTAIKDLNNL